MHDNELNVNGIEYVRKEALVKGCPYVIVRGRNVGVHAGYLAEDVPNRMVLRDACRIWHWEGAGSLSGLAVYGTSRPGGCHFGAPIARQELRGLDSQGDYEVIHCTETARISIQEVKPWVA
jgi:hypothetical protein